MEVVYALRGDWSPYPLLVLGFFFFCFSFFSILLLPILLLADGMFDLHIQQVFLIPECLNRGLVLWILRLQLPLGSKDSVCDNKNLTTSIGGCWLRLFWGSRPPFIIYGHLQRLWWFDVYHRVSYWYIDLATTVFVKLDVTVFSTLTLRSYDCNILFVFYIA